MFVKFRKYFIRFIIIIIAGGLILKGLTFIPINNLNEIFADKIVFLQQVTRNLEEFFVNVGEVYQQVVRDKKEAKKYQAIYKEALSLNKLYEAIKAENNMLRKKLRFKDHYRDQLLPAEIISRSEESWDQYIIINKGSANSIKEEQIVINEEGLVGYVDTVWLSSSKVVLITDPKFTISCRNIRNKEVGILRGNRFYPMSLDYIRYNSDVLVGDQLVSSGHSLRFPANLVIGYVSKIRKEKRKIFISVEVDPAVNFSKLDIVFIIK